MRVVLQGRHATLDGAPARENVVEPEGAVEVRSRVRLGGAAERRLHPRDPVRLAEVVTKREGPDGEESAGR